MERVQNSVTEELYHTDISAEDDSLLTSSSSLPFLNPQFSENQIEKHGFELSDPEEAIHVAEDSGPSEELHQPSGSNEPEKTRSVKCNLRKSLAWDNAFFTNAGVLDAEELSNMIGGVDHGKHVLPSIQEDDLQGSMESISTLDSDPTLESLEADLFQDIRASIQKSSKAPTAANSSAPVRSRGKDPPAVKSSNKVAPASRNKATVKQASSKLNIGSQGSGKEMMKGSVCPELTQKKPATRNSEPTSSIPKIPRPSGKVNLIPASSTKRASLAGANRVKTETSTAAVRGPLSSKVPSTHKVVPRPTLSSQSTSTRRSSTTASTGPDTSSSSLDSSISSSPVNVVTAQTISMKGKSNSRVSNPLNSGQAPKTPLRIRLKNKPEHGNSHLSDYLRSSSSKSSSISPSSSISEWSCESFSSTSTANQRSSNSKASIGTSSPCVDGGSVDGVSNGINPQKHTNKQVLGGQKNLVARLSSQSINEALTGTGALPHPAAAKPSGLRMPSPKIGFFDGVKLQVRTPKGGLQPHSGALNVAGSFSPRDEKSSKSKNFQSGKATIEVQGDELSRTLETIDLNSGIQKDGLCQQ